MVIFFNDTATTEIYTLSLHDALPICRLRIFLIENRVSYLAASGRELQLDGRSSAIPRSFCLTSLCQTWTLNCALRCGSKSRRSEEHTSELQTRQYLVCRLVLEKKRYN